jgi:tetratricopeptide (TPR) repeat protein
MPFRFTWAMQDPIKMPLETLQETVNHLKEGWERSARFVSDQEEELALQDQIVAEIEAQLQLQIIDEGDRLQLEAELVNERERQQLLEASLAGQSENLSKQKAIYEQYRQVLQQRQGVLMRAKQWLNYQRRGLILASLGLLGVGVAGWFAISRLMPTSQQSQTPSGEIQYYQTLLERNPKDFNALVSLVNLYLEQGQLEAALPLMEKIVQQQPDNLPWKLNLANLYGLMDNQQKAEAIYDQILADNPNHIEALVAKAKLRSQQGDIQTARFLFEKAEKAAMSRDLKAQIREIARRFLKS